MTVDTNNGQRSRMLKCDDTAGLTIATWHNLNCEGAVNDITPYLNASGTCSGKDYNSMSRRLLKCVDRSKDSRPDWQTAAPSPPPHHDGVKGVNCGTGILVVMFVSWMWN